MSLSDLVSFMLAILYLLTQTQSALIYKAGLSCQWGNYISQSWFPELGERILRIQLYCRAQKTEHTCNTE